MSKISVPRQISRLKLKMHQIRFPLALRSAPDPAGKLTQLRRLAVFTGRTSMGRAETERRGEG